MLNLIGLGLVWADRLNSRPMFSLCLLVETVESSEFPLSSSLLKLEKCPWSLFNTLLVNSSQRNSNSKTMEIDFQEYQLSSELRGHEEDVSNLFILIQHTHNFLFKFLQFISTIIDFIRKQFVECPRKMPNFNFNLVVIWIPMIFRSDGYVYAEMGV